MTPRQARTERRAAERKAKKAETRRNPAERNPDCKGGEASFAEADAMRDGVQRRAAALKLATYNGDHPADLSSDREGAPTNPGFVSQSSSPVAAPQPSGFVPQCPAPGTPAREPGFISRAEINPANSQHSTGQASGAIAAFRAQAKAATQLGQPLPPLPAQIRELQRGRTALLVQHFVNLQTALGPDTTSRLDQYLAREFTPHLRMKRVALPAAGPH